MRRRRHRWPGGRGRRGGCRSRGIAAVGRVVRSGCQGWRAIQAADEPGAHYQRERAQQSYGQHQFFRYHGKGAPH